MLHKTLVAAVAAVALGCVPMATDALAGPYGHGRHMVTDYRGGHVVRYGGGYRTGPIYDSCSGYGYGYGYGGCRGYGVPLVGGVINGVFGGYGRY